MKKNKTIGIFIAAAVIIGALAFFGGMKFSQNKNSGQNRMGFQNLTPEQREKFQQTGGRQGGKMGGSMMAGEILSKDDKSITVKLSDGGSKIIFYSASTTVAKMAEGALTDLTVGLNISANGSQNSDGSITAQSIQIRPQIQTPPPQPAP